MLVYEFDFDDRVESNRKIKRKLRYHGLGTYAQDRVDLLRALKDEVQREIDLGQNSRYFVGPPGKYSSMNDFDIDSMAADLAKAFPTVPKDELVGFLGFAVYAYYLR